MGGLSIRLGGRLEASGASGVAWFHFSILSMLCPKATLDAIGWTLIVLSLGTCLGLVCTVVGLRGLERFRSPSCNLKGDYEVPVFLILLSLR